MAPPGAQKLSPVEGATQELGRSIVALLLKEPFFGHLLGGVVRRIDRTVPTAAVALTPRGLQLLVNPEFFMGELKRDERVAVIKHEALHLVYRHLYRKLMRNGDQKLFNIAADLVVNQYVAPWPLPETAVTLNLFPDMGMERDQTLEWYYEKLKSLQKADDREQSPKSSEALDSLVGQDECHGDHRYWASSGGEGFAPPGDLTGVMPTLSDALRNALETDLERHLLRARDQTSSQQWGKLPAGIQVEIEQIAQARKPQVDWRRSLRLFALSGYRTSVVATNRRMSKRFNTFPGIRIQREQRVAVVLDTSGSIGQTTVELFFAEVRGIWRTGAEVVVVESDADVQQTYQYKGKTPNAVKGGGGTSFDPALEWVSQSRNGTFDVCVYLTDGCGPAPAVRMRCPLLWVVTAEGMVGEHLRPGRVIRLPNVE